MSLANQRHLFDMPDGVVYMNCAAQGPAPIAARDAGRRAVDRKARPWEPERQRLTAEMARCRELFAGFIGAAADDIALTGATSYAMAVAAANVRVEPGKTIVMLEAQFPSNYYIWRRVAARDGAEVVIVPRPADGDWTSAVLERLGPETGLVALPNVHWVDGGVVDLLPIATAAHADGAILVIDATQSVGAYPFDVRRIDPDFVACSAYKWLLSPDQSGYLYVAPRHQHGEPVEHNHATRIGEAPMTLSPGYGERFRHGASRFDQGTADSMIHVPMAAAAMEQIAEWGVERIAGAMAPLVDRIADEAEVRGWRVPPKAHRSPHFIGLTLPEPPAPDLAERLAAEDVHVSLRDGRIRVSPYLFNAVEDVAALFAALDRALRR
ncbi:MAG: aminotransferase class V-fold PLP-dependent enzyme [Thalassobaculum sp.]|uniref:aminotransferase class V-fold PLP-dependent enzyme n=1 Tax=Thalassobaculum sp. TaxID=2022740 RepID=UPI0032EFBFBF